MKTFKTSVVSGLAIAGLFLGACGGLSGQNDEGIRASGVIEVTTITLSSEIGGTVAEHLVEEGKAVEVGEILIRLDSQLLDAQLVQAEAILIMAEATYAQIAASSSTERLLAQQAIDDLYSNADVARANKMLEIANLRDAVSDAERRVSSLEQGGKQTDIDSARASVILLVDELEDEQEDYEDYANRPETNLDRAAQQLKLAEVQSRYDDAVRRLNSLEADANSIDLSIAEANLLLAESMLIVAQSDLEDLQEGPDPDALALAEARLASANASLVVAQAQVDSAQATFEVLRVQAEKSQILSPINALVLNQLVEKGETVLPGTPLITLSEPSEISITVFIPEDRYGQISLGDVAEVTVDSFEGELFDAVVVRIADQAEYTPRNVQTEEDRRTTVFAIELAIKDSGGKLKSGMPGDVVFSN